MTTSAPLPPVSAWIAGTGSASLLLTVCVAPIFRAPSSFRSSMSTAMIVSAPGQRGARDRGRADAAAADHGDALAARDVAGVDRRAEPGHHAAAEQPDRGGARGRVDLGALARPRPGSSRRTHRCPSAGDSSVPSAQGHLLGGVVGREAVPRLAAVAGPAVAADRPPVEDHEVARGHRGDVVADGLDHTGGLVPEQEREVVVDRRPRGSAGRCGTRRTPGPGPAPRPGRGRGR